MKEEKNNKKVKKSDLRESALSLIEKQLKECQKTKEEYLNGWKRAKADFLNYRNEEGERIKRFITAEKREFIFNLLSVLDNFYVAEKELPGDLRSNQWADGVLKIKTQILNLLANQGVKEIESLNKKFDPNFHEAVEMVESKNYQSGIVVEEIKKGYLFEGQVLRPAQVKVAR